MSRYIDADAIKDKSWKAESEACFYALEDVVSVTDIDEAPSIELKRGEWKRRIVDNGFNADWVCSECGYRVKTDFVDYNYCPNCGADMRKESE